MANKSQGWQCELSLVERNRHMLQNGIATDTLFRVGPPNGNTLDIPAHTYMLISSSPVFEAMFSGDWAERETMVRIEDVDGEIFFEMLSFIYCETANVNSSSVLPLLYVAKKYMLHKLRHQCENYVKENLTMDNVYFFLEQSFIFHTEDLKSSCLKLLSLDLEKIAKNGDLKKVSFDALEAILDMETMECNESSLYKACVDWAISNLPESSMYNPTDVLIRNKLGHLLYKIRFPVMDMREFTELTQDKEVLNAQEKLSTYCFMSTGMKREDMLFKCDSRQTYDEKLIDRVNASMQNQVYNKCFRGVTPETTYRVRITPSSHIFLTGILTANLSIQGNLKLLIRKDDGFITNEELSILPADPNGTNESYKRNRTMPSFKAPLTHPVLICKGVEHELLLTCPNGTQFYRRSHFPKVQTVDLESSSETQITENVKVMFEETSNDLEIYNAIEGIFFKYSS